MSGKYITFNRDEYEAYWEHLSAGLLSSSSRIRPPVEVTTEQMLAEKGHEDKMIEMPPGDATFGQSISIKELRDNVVSRSLIYEVDGNKVPMVAMNFANSIDLEHLTTQVVFGGSPESMRATGRLLRDTFNRAANVAEGKP